MRLSKHHGLGNDFLVSLQQRAQLDDEPGGLADLARRVCDRRTGIGADGLIVGLMGPDGGVRMVLHNSDGSRAAMSGNGIRCLAHAVARDRGAGAIELTIETDGGRRAVTVDGDGSAVQASVDMGPVAPGPEVSPGLAAELDGARFATGDVGNPHLVIEVDDPLAVDVATVGAAHETHFAAGMNVEFIAPTQGETDALDFRVWERGAGVTQACGTGATVAASL
ncbi:MAG: diaminopimelate epimerase, partial [Actinomycetota bacterium]|nr:diaminopimelate epimerase [Actinomycetota bacterium]